MFRVSWNVFLEISVSRSLDSMADRKKTVPWRCPCPNPWRTWMCYFTLEKGLFRCVNLRSWDMEIILNNLGGSNIVIGSIYKRGSGGQSGKVIWQLEDALAAGSADAGRDHVPMDAGHKSAASKSWKKEGTRASPGILRWTTALLTHFELLTSRNIINSYLF